MKIITAILLSSCTVFSATLECQSLINLEVVSKSVINTELKEKNLITKNDQFISYVTETDHDQFSVEAFIPNLEVRIYSEGPLHNLEQKLSLVEWGRDILAEVVCKKLK